MRRRRDPGAAGDDAAVIASSRREPERFAVLFDRHAPHIYRYLARRAGRQAADDLVAETFLAAFAKRDRYDLGHPDARPWLYGIATNLVGQQRRDEARQHRIRQAAAAEPDVPGHADRVAADVTAQAMRPLLTAALAALPAGDRDVLLLVAWEPSHDPATARRARRARIRCAAFTCRSGRRVRARATRLLQPQPQPQHTALSSGAVSSP